MPNHLRKPIAEFCGTFILVLFGCGVVHTATLYDAQVGLGQIALVWGLAVMFGIYVCGAVSGGHLNPAMTLAFATGNFSIFSWRLQWAKAILLTCVSAL